MEMTTEEENVRSEEFELYREIPNLINKTTALADRTDLDSRGKRKLNHVQRCLACASENRLLHVPVGFGDLHERV